MRLVRASQASDEAVVKEYIRALAQTNQLSRLSLAQLASAGGAQAAGMRDGALGIDAGSSPMGGASSRGTIEQPLHVQVSATPVCTH